MSDIIIEIAWECFDCCEQNHDEFEFDVLKLTDGIILKAERTVKCQECGHTFEVECSETLKVQEK